MATQQQPIFCKHCHRVELTFNESFKSKSGKYIPIAKASGVPHKCSANPNQQQQQQQQSHEPQIEGTINLQPIQKQQQQQQENHRIEKMLITLIEKVDYLNKLVYAQSQSSQK